MEFVRLPWLSRRLGRDVVAGIEPFLGPERPAEPPPGALLVTTSWPSSRVAVQMPQEVPGGRCFAALSPERRRDAWIAWERWIDAFVQEAVTGPEAIRDNSRRLGPDRDFLAHVLCRMWSFTTDAEWQEFLRQTGREDPGIRFPAFPSEATQEALVLMGRTFKILPSDLVERPAPKFAFDFRLLLRRFARAPEDESAAALLEGVA